MPPKFERVLDIGVTFDLDNGSYFIVTNLINEKKRFFGGSYVGTAEKLGEIYSFVDDIELLQKIEMIQKKFIALGVVGTCEVDMFYYKENNKIRPYYMVEINYRKTLGPMIKSLFEKWPAEMNVWLIIPNKFLTSQLYTDIYKKDITEIIITSPEKNYFTTIYFNLKSKQDFLARLNSFEENYVKPSGLNFMLKFKSQFFNHHS